MGRGNGGGIDRGLRVAPWAGGGPVVVVRVIVLCSMLLWRAGAQAWGAEPALVADAHVNSALPTVNSGAISNLDVGGGYTTLLQFDLSLLPAGTTAGKVSRAVLRLYCNRVTTPGLVSFAPVTGAWGEYSVTYATEPAIGSAAGVFSVGQDGAFVAVDVTSLVQGWISSPATNFGLALSAGTAMVQFDSKENDLTAHAPTLDVELVDAGTAGSNGAGWAAGVAWCYRGDRAARDSRDNRAARAYGRNRSHRRNRAARASRRDRSYRSDRAARTDWRDRAGWSPQDLPAAVQGWITRGRTPRRPTTRWATWRSIRGRATSR